MGRWFATAVILAVGLALIGCTTSRHSFVVDITAPYTFDEVSERAPHGGAPHQVVLIQDGHTQTVLEWDCWYLQGVADYDRDGLDEAMVSHSPGCAGNCCPSTTLFVDVDTKGQVHVTGHSVPDWDGPDIAETAEGWRFTAVYSPAGVGYTEMTRTTQEFALADGELVELERFEAVQIPASPEVRSHTQETAQLVADLDGDGIEETIECRAWERWATLHDCALVTLDDGPIPLTIQGRRIGVLESTTNGWNDLVAGLDTIYVWNGTTYVVAG